VEAKVFVTAAYSELGGMIYIADDWYFAAEKAVVSSAAALRAKSTVTLPTKDVLRPFVVLSKTCWRRKE
jgi:hypothetical protein